MTTISDNIVLKESSCITDKPLLNGKEDKLKAIDYSNALYNFITNAETPVTIGIQGGWGSGKTSLISMLKEKLDNDQNHRTLTVFVNAWEHALFQAADNKAEVALSLLKGLYDQLKAEATNKSNKDNSDHWIDKKKADNAFNITAEQMRNTFSVLKKALILSVGIVRGVNLTLDENKDNNNNNFELPSVASNLHNLRQDLNTTITLLTGGGLPEKIVFFIDDLDRVPPETAVEILDITKNIFDIENCVFVLAIDYEVIVKGLRKKFGEKNSENERKFRQYFDKIIQIPFTMPVGAYSNYVSNMIQTALLKLKYPLLEENGKMNLENESLVTRLSNEAVWATGGVPRSIKRIINTLSLLQHISDSESGNKDNIDYKQRLGELEIRFIIVALQIEFPEICRCIMTRINFIQWKRSELSVKWRLNTDSLKEELDALDKDELFDEEWEKVLYCLCAKSTWLKSQARNISNLLNNLRNALNAKGKKTIDDAMLTVFTDILNSIRVVSIEPETASQIIDDSNIKNDYCSCFCKNLARSFHTYLNVKSDFDEESYATGNGIRGRRDYSISIKEWIENNKYFDSIYICWTGQRGNNKNIIDIGFNIIKPDKNLRDFYKLLKDIDFDGTPEYYYDKETCFLEYDCKYDDFDNNIKNINKFLNDLIMLYNSINEQLSNY